MDFQKYQIVSVVLISFFLQACASGKKATTESPSFRSISAEAKNMAPPQLKDGEPVNVDPLYMRTQADYHFAVGESYSLEGNTQRAIESFKLAAVYDVNSADVFLRLATEYVRAGLVSEALEQAETGLEKEPNHRDLHLFVGGLYATMKVYPKALEHYNKLLTDNPKDQGVQLYVGALYADQGMHKEAEEAFYKVTKIKVKEDDKSYLAYLYLSKLELLKNAQNYSGAEKWLKTAMKVRPNFDEGVITLADLYEAQKKTSTWVQLLESYQKKYGPAQVIAQRLSQHYLAIEDYKNALGHLRILEEFDPSNLSVQMKIALILIEQKDYDNAIDRLERILSSTPESDKVRYYLAAVYEETKDNNLAVQNYRAIDVVSSYYPDAVIRAANILKTNNLAEASRILAEALSHRADSANLFSFYAALLDESKDYEQGISVLEKAEKKFPKNTQIMYYLGNLYDRVGKPNKTISKMREVIELDQNHFHALNYLSYTLAENGNDLDEAEQLALRALDLQPNNAYILDTVGWVYYKKGNFEESIRYLEAAFKQKPNESIIAEHLGDAYYVYQLTEKARDMYLRAEALETDTSKLSEIRKKISNIQAPPKDRQPASASSRD